MEKGKHRSEIARLREQIAAEYMAAKLGLEGLRSGTARHDFITARQERIGALHEELQQLVENEAFVLVAQTLEVLPEIATPQETLAVASGEPESSEGKEQKR